MNLNRATIKTVLSLALALGGLGTATRAATNTPASAPSSNRYLLIVETSRTMEPRAEGALRAVQDMLLSRMKGQLHKGDTLGVWTYNENLYTGLFPLQSWSPETQTNTIKLTLSFLAHQKWEKQARWDRVLPALQRVVTNSEMMSVLLFSSGLEELRGTPFDEPINANYRQWRAQQQEARMPFITFLRTRNGRATDYAVSAFPWPIELPPLPQSIRSNGIVSTAAKPPKAAATLAPLILSGKKPEAPATKTVEGSHPPAAPPPTPPPETNNGAAPASKAETALASATPTVMQAPKTEPVTNAVVPSDAGPGVTAQESGSSPTNAPIAPTLALLSEADKVPARLESPGAAQPERSIEAASTNVSKLAHQSATLRNPRGAEQVSNPPANPPTHLAAAQPSPRFFGLKALAAAGLGLAAAAAGLVWFWKNRSRPAARVSVITRSLDREKR